MRARYMRIMVMFDLPTQTKKDVKNYRDFRKFLITSGFVMMQESIYTKIVLNPTKANTVLNNIKKIVPKNGLIQVLIITEKQYSQMLLLVGEISDEVINNDKRILIL